MNKEQRIKYHKEYYEKNKEALTSKRKERYSKNKEAVLKQVKEYYEKNKEVDRARKKAWKLANKEKVKQQSRAYYENNKQKIKAYVNSWREKNRDKINEKSKNKRNENKLNRLEQQLLTPTPKVKPVLQYTIARDVVIPPKKQLKIDVEETKCILLYPNTTNDNIVLKKGQKVDANILKQSKIIKKAYV